MKFRFTLLWGLVVAGGVGLSRVEAAAETFYVDAAHSSISFTIKRFFANVPGSFSRFEGTLVFDRDRPETSTLQAKVDVASVNTADAKRDDHLRSVDFFEVAKFPTATFRSTSWKKSGPDTYEVTGEFTLHGVTKPVVLAVKSLGFKPGAQPASNVSSWEGRPP